MLSGVKLRGLSQLLRFLLLPSVTDSPVSAAPMPEGLWTAACRVSWSADPVQRGPWTSCRGLLIRVRISLKVNPPRTTRQR